MTLVDEPFKSGDQVIAFVNSMGGTPVSELYAVYAKLDEICQGSRRDHRPQPDWTVHHLAGDAGHVDHPAEGG